jgi:hypothetical protein
MKIELTYEELEKFAIDNQNKGLVYATELIKLKRNHIDKKPLDSKLECIEMLESTLIWNSTQDYTSRSCKSKSITCNYPNKVCIYSGGGVIGDLCDHCK